MCVCVCEERMRIVKKIYIYIMRISQVQTALA